MTNNTIVILENHSKKLIGELWIKWSEQNKRNNQYLTNAGWTADGIIAFANYCMWYFIETWLDTAGE